MGKKEKDFEVLIAILVLAMSKNPGNSLIQLATSFASHNHISKFLN